jgi:hypothetical protein
MSGFRLLFGKHVSTILALPNAAAKAAVTDMLPM